MGESALPDDDDDAVEDVVRVPDVAEQTEGQQHEAHLQDEHAGEHDVADLQHVRQLLGLARGRRLAPLMCIVNRNMHGKC